MVSATAQLTFIIRGFVQVQILLEAFILVKNLGNSPEWKEDLTFLLAQSQQEKH